MPRFLLLVLTPALAACALVILLAGDARDERRGQRLESLADPLAALVRHDLATAWSYLEAEAGPAPAADTTLRAVRSALAGDTVRGLGAGPEGPVVSILFARGDTLRTASATFTPPLTESIANRTDLEIGLYLRGARVLPPRSSAAPSELPDSIATGPGAGVGDDVRIAPLASTALGLGEDQVLLAVRSTEGGGAVLSLGTWMAALLLTGLAVVSAASGFRGEPGAAAGGRVTLAVVLVAGTTVVVSGWVALGEIRRVDAAEMRDRTTREALTEMAEARGRTAVEAISFTEPPSGPVDPAPLLWIALAGTVIVTAGAVHVAGVARNRTTPASGTDQ